MFVEEKRDSTSIFLNWHQNEYFFAQNLVYNSKIHILKNLIVMPENKI